MRVDCMLSLNAAELQSFCVASSTDTGVTTLQQQLLNLNSATHIGRWGNSDALSPNDWLQISQQSFPFGAQYSTSLRQCDGIPTGARLDVAYGPFGSTLNVQRGIVGASFTWVTSSIRHTLVDPTARQDFALSFQVRFLPVGGSSADFVPSPAPVAPPLARDTLYPFYVPSGNSAWVSTGLTAIVMCLASLLAL